MTMTTKASILHVEGMSCSHCENRIKKVVGALKGVMGVSVDMKGKTVSVDFDAELVSLTEIKNAIEDQGYEVK